LNRQDAKAAKKFNIRSSVMRHHLFMMEEGLPVSVTLLSRSQLTHSGFLGGLGVLAVKILLYDK